MDLMNSKVVADLCSLTVRIYFSLHATDPPPDASGDKQGALKPSRQFCFLL